MDVLLKILLVIAIIVAILIMVLMFFLLYPFKYDIDITYDEKLLVLTFKYSIISFFLSFDFSNPVKCRFKLFTVTVYDSESSSKTAEKSELDTREKSQPENRQVEKITKSDQLLENEKDKKEIVKDLFASAKKMETKQKEERRIDGEKAESFIDKFKGFISRDTIYVFKKILKELKKTLIFVLPKKYKVEITYGIQDPYTMGLSQMIIAPISIMGGKNVDIKSRFMVDTFKGHIHMSNRMPKMCLVAPVIRLFLDKRFREIILKK